MPTHRQPYEDLIPILEEVKGDSTLYAGMLAHLGDSKAKQYIRKCIDTNGQIWRNPEAASQSSQYINSNSRDMFMGVLLGGSQSDLISVASYLKKTNGKLSPKASDNRNKVGMVGWAQLGVALGNLASIQIMGLKGFMLSKILKPFLGLIALLEAVTVYQNYQINLIYCAIMFYRDHKIAKWWEPKILKAIRKIRGQDDMVINFLEGNLRHIQSELPHMHNRRKWALAHKTPISGWPLDWFTVEFPSEAFIYWLEGAALKLLQKRSTKVEK